MKPFSNCIKKEKEKTISSDAVSRIEAYDWSGDDYESFHKYHVTREDREVAVHKYGHEVCWQCENEPARDNYAAEGKRFCSAKCLVEYLSLGDEESRLNDAYRLTE